MYRFLLTRAVGLAFVLFAITFITFIFGYLAMSTRTDDPIIAMLGTHRDPRLYAQLKHEYGLDLPWWQQYYNFVSQALHGTFGLSFTYENEDAIDVLRHGLPATIELGLEVLVVTLIIGIPLGIFSALRANTHADTTATLVSLLLYCVPTIVFIVYFQVLMVWLYNQGLPHLNVAGWDTWQDRIGPVLVTATTGAGYFSRLTRITILETLGQDYIRTARAKGLSERVVIYLHVLRNACIPLLTVIGPSLGFIVTGLYFTEAFFNIPGVASLTLAAIGQQDYPVVQASTVLLASSVVFFNALTDIAYAVADPRIRVE